MQFDWPTRRNVLASVLPIGLLVLGTAAAAQDLELAGSACEPSWVPTFGQTPGINDSVWALTAFDDGGGPALYAGGFLTSAGGVLANHVAKWTGSSWEALGSGTNGYVYALAAFDDGAGPALYAGGEFTSAGGVPANDIARWDGSSWSALGSGIGGAGGDPVVHALAVFDDGSGEALYVGGGFSSAGGVPVSNIAKWNGSSWTPLGSGVGHYVWGLAVFDDGSGEALYAGGVFTSAGGAAANRIARWNGSSWAPLGSGTDAPVHALAAFDDGGGPALYAGGFFTSAGGAAANQIARWNGSSWAPLGSGTDGYIHALAVFDDGGAETLCAGGFFMSAGSAGAQSIARWDGASWSGLGNGMQGGVNALALFDDGSGPALHAGGWFTSAGGGVAANRIAKWDGSSWSPLSSGTNGVFIYALAVFDDGNGPALYVGGDFTTAGGVPANRIAKWDGSSWSALGSGVAGNSSPYGDPSVHALAVFDDGSGPALYVGGRFTIAGGVAANRIAKWNGSTWSPLGAGTGNGLDPSVYALTVHDDGGGPALYVGGGFTRAGGMTANRIAKWSGSAWSPLGSGMANGHCDDEGACYTDVTALAVFDDGNGPALYAGGDFTWAGGAANRIAKWNGSTWSPLGSGLEFSGFGWGFPTVRALAVFDGGGGPALYAGGFFTLAGGVEASGIATWDGTSWSPLGSGTIGNVEALLVRGDGNGPSLFAGGWFSGVPDSGDSYLARWLGCDTNPPSLSCPSSVSVIDRLGTPSGEFVTFTVTASDDLDPAPNVVCVPPSGSFFPQGTTLVECTATDASGNESTCEFPVRVALKLGQRSQ